MSPTSYSSPTAGTTTTTIPGLPTHATRLDLGRFPGAEMTSGDGVPTGLPGARPPRPPLPHIDDLVNVVPDITLGRSIDATLTYGEGCIKNAEAFKTFGRPEAALKEYLKATTIVVEYIPKNQEFPSLLARKPLVARRHTALMKRVHQLHSTFDQIKEDIKRDNLISGVQPKSARLVKTQSEPARLGPARPASPPSTRGQVTNGATNGSGPASIHGAAHGSGTSHGGQNSQEAPVSGVGGSPSPRGRPSVQPKPLALHGNVLKPATPGPGLGSGPGQAASKTPHDLLLERFANLRGPRTSTDLDNSASNQTSPTSQRPLRPRISPGEPVNISLISDLPEIKAPPAIYSPARGTVSHEAANLPSSNSRGMFTRTGSTQSLAGQVKSPPPLNAEFFGSSAPNFGAAVTAPQRPKPPIPDRDTISPKELFNFQKASTLGFKMLIIDVRDRGEFDEGHINSQSTICIPPESLDRDNISAEDVEASMVVGPQREQDLFRDRGNYDLVVFYDNDSEEINYRSGTPQENALRALYSALKLYDYGSEKSTDPKLLKGGLDAWLGLMGPSSLQESKTVPDAPGMVPRARPIQDPVEARRWEENLSKMQNTLMRTQDEFLRRFPSVSAMQESMTSPTVERPQPQQRPQSPSPPTPRSAHSRLPSSVQNIESMPPPPMRPPPAVPRQSHTGLMETGNEEHYASPTGLVTKASRERKGRPKPVGLDNPNFWCYANSSVQALFHSFGFALDLTGNGWMDKWTVPKRAGENLNNPQLLTKIVSNLFHWMNNGQFESMQCKTLMDYVHFVDSKSYKPKESVLGSQNHQQDAGEFIMFLMGHIHDETNRLRDVDDKGISFPKDADKHECAAQFWESYRRSNDSIVDQYFRGLQRDTFTCSSCGHVTYSYAAWDKLAITFPEDHHKDSIDLRTMLRANWPDAGEARKDYRCDGCKEVGHTACRQRHVRLPELLCITVNFAKNERDKVKTRIEYPVEHLDLTEFTDALPASMADRPEGLEWDGPFTYECYASILHIGNDIKSGHYVAFVRDQGRGSGGKSDWHLCSDINVQKYIIDSDAAAKRQGMYEKGSVAVLFYRRKRPAS